MVSGRSCLCFTRSTFLRLLNDQNLKGLIGRLTREITCICTLHLHLGVRTGRLKDLLDRVGGRVEKFRQKSREGIEIGFEGEEKDEDIEGSDKSVLWSR